MSSDALHERQRTSNASPLKATPKIFLEIHGFLVARETNITDGPVRHSTAVDQTIDGAIKRGACVEVVPGRSEKRRRGVRVKNQPKSIGSRVTQNWAIGKMPSRSLRSTVNSDCICGSAGWPCYRLGHHHGDDSMLARADACVNRDPLATACGRLACHDKKPGLQPRTLARAVQGSTDKQLGL